MKGPSESAEAKELRLAERRKATVERNSATERSASGMSSDIDRAYGNPFSMFNIFKRRS